VQKVRLLVSRVWDLLFRAKHLFVAARTRQSSTKDRAGDGAAAGMSRAVRSVRRVMVVAGREATYPGPGAKRITGLPVRHAQRCRRALPARFASASLVSDGWFSYLLRLRCCAPRFFTG
jgi:hypothetical protein